MAIEILECEQGSPEWLSARAGWPSASEAANIMGKDGPRGGVHKGRQKLLWRLAGERITGLPESTYSNGHMARGSENESEARALYEMLSGNEVVEVGTIRNGNCSASPDGLIGGDGLVEIKDAIGSVQVERLLKGTLPTEHKPQCQMLLMVSEREWVAFMSHSRGLPPLIVRVERDEKYIAELRRSVDAFCEELDALVAKIEGM